MKLDSFRLKILALRSFHKTHIMSSARLRNAFRGVPAVVVMLIHHSSAVFAIFQFEGFRRGSWTQSAIWSQILLVKRQSASRWRAVSIVCLHRAQVALCGHPRVANLSADQTRFWSISHAKNLHFGGAHVQIHENFGAVMVPRNCALYAEAVEYSPVAESFHLMVSCVPFCSTVCRTRPPELHKLY